jgi:deoxyribose-phosphate aldolase
MAIFQARHYQQIASAVARCGWPHAKVVLELCSMFNRDNKNFKPYIFAIDCNFVGSSVGDSPMKTFTIELRVDFEDQAPEKDKIMEDAVKEAAKHLYTQSLLISGIRRPALKAHRSDMFAGCEEIDLNEEGV